MATPLPPFWSEEKDPRGRTYYSNHQTRETTWERPVAAPAAVSQERPPPYGSNAPLPSQGPCCTPRLTFWITLGLGWIVWTFAVVAAADDDWIEDLDIAAGDEDLLDCDDDNDFCKQYKAFTAMQFIAVLLVSFAMVVFVLTLFRPARGGCCSVKTVAVIGASLMTGFAFFQMLAFVLMIVIEKDLDDEGGDARLGGTFAMAVLACILGVVHAAAVFVFARSAGDGLLYKCCNTCMAMNNESNAAPNSAAGGTAAYNTNQQQPVPPATSTTVTLSAPAAPPEPASAAV